MRALNLQDPVRRDTADDGGANLRAPGVVDPGNRAEPELPRRDARGVRERDGRARAPICSTSCYDETAALFADLSWDITEQAHARVRRYGRKRTRTSARIRSATARRRRTSAKPFPWNDPTTACAIRSVTPRSTRRSWARRSSTRRTARVSVQYQFTDDLMAYVTLVERLRTRRRHR